MASPAKYKHDILFAVLMGYTMSASADTVAITPISPVSPGYGSLRVTTTLSGTTPGGPHGRAVAGIMYVTGNYTWMDGGSTVPIPSSVTWDQAIRAWTDRHGTNSVVSVRPDLIRADRVCFGTGNSGGGDSNGQVLVASCVPLPLPPAMCTIDNGHPTIDHRQVPGLTWAGHTARMTLTTTCLTATTIQIDNPAGNGPINIGPSMTTILRVNGRDLGQPLTMMTGNNTLELSSTLGGATPQPGPFEATVVLRVTFP